MPSDSDLEYAGGRLRPIGTRILAHASGHDHHQGHAAAVNTTSDLDVPAFIKASQVLEVRLQSETSAYGRLIESGRVQL